MAADLTIFKKFNQLLIVFVYMCLTLSHVLSHEVPKFDSVISGTHKHEKFASKQEHQERRYLLYEVNHGEGFNLRRDVYMRMANLVKSLNEQHERWTLVLPPWGRVYHWKSRADQHRIPWRTFFDLDSLRHYIPVMELEDYLEMEGTVIEETYYLQSYSEGWDGHWEEKLDVRPCINEQIMYEEDLDEGIWTGWFWGYGEVMTTRKFQCLSIQGHAGFLKHLLQRTDSKSVLIDRAETVLHDHFGDKRYWQARRSMVFNTALITLGDEFRREFLNSDDIRDRTEREAWWEMKRSPGSAVGGDYLSVHLRRADFLFGHKKDVPSLEGAAEQISKLLEKLKLTVVFVATDAPDTEYGELKRHLSAYVVHRYRPSDAVLQQYQDGGVAIIDQWIAAHARYFIGTHVSTFSYRIQEEREILGFKPETSFNCMCPDDSSKCEQPSKWTIVY